LCIPSSRAESEFLSQVTAVQGWVLEYDQHSSAWRIFLFCFLRDVIIPSEHMAVISCIPTSLAFGDFLLANRRGTLRSLLDDSELHLEREVLHVVAVHSKLLQLQDELPVCWIVGNFGTNWRLLFSLIFSHWWIVRLLFSLFLIMTLKEMLFK
jgi:hypothetical protein